MNTLYFLLLLPVTSPCSEGICRVQTPPSNAKFPVGHTVVPTIPLVRGLPPRTTTPPSSVPSSACYTSRCSCPRTAPLPPPGPALPTKTFPIVTTFRRPTAPPGHVWVKGKLIRPALGPSASPGACFGCSATNTRSTRCR